MSEIGTGPLPLSRVERLWRNHRKYCGDTIEIKRVLGNCVAAAEAAGWRIERMLPSAPHGLPALVRKATDSSTKTPLKLYISAGIHGDEPASSLAALALLQQNTWPANLDLWLCPCLNPDGFDLNTRENAWGIDLNRQYRKPRAIETSAHMRWLRAQPSFDLALCLHEDWETSGFYVYELNPDNQPSFAETMISSVETACPIDRSDLIEGWPAKDGVIRPAAEPKERPEWPEAFYLITHKTHLSYTLEAPSDYPLHVRTTALVAAATAAAAALAVR